MKTITYKDAKREIALAKRIIALRQFRRAHRSIYPTAKEVAANMKDLSVELKLCGGLGSIGDLTAEQK